MESWIRVCSHVGFSPKGKSTTESGLNLLLKFAPVVHILDTDCINEAAVFAVFLDTGYTHFKGANLCLSCPKRNLNRFCVKEVTRHFDFFFHFYGSSECSQAHSITRLHSEFPKKRTEGDTQVWLTFHSLQLAMSQSQLVS